ncbi:MAG: hypothetical protein R3A46_00760 [Thermomicrobiales bacterium]
MTQKLTLQIALMTLIASCLTLVLVVVAGGLAGPAAVDMGQIVPLALASAAAFVVILINPFERSPR